MSRPVRPFRPLVVAVAGLLLLASAGPARAETIKFQQGGGPSASPFSATNDTYISGGTSHGNEPFFTASTGEKVGLLSFPQLIGGATGQVPAGATINSAVLSLCFPDAAPAGGYPDLYVYKATSPWTESSTTAPSFDPASKLTFAGSTFHRYHNNKLDVTAIVAKWAAGEPNYGFVFQTSRGFLRIGASEHNSLGEHPVLTVDYTPKPVPAPPGVVLAGMGFGGLLLGRFRRKS